jgi:hypothetical protein
MKPEDIQKKLFVSTSDKYGDKYVDHLLEQYKIYIDSAEKISDRRQKTNEFFLGLNTGLVALLGFVVTKTSHTGYILGLSSLAGATMCYLWYRILMSYKGLNDGKFKVVHAIELRLPLALYDTEWEILGRGEDKEKYWPFSHIEIYVPWIFMTIYLILFLSILPWKFIIFCLF